MRGGALRRCGSLAALAAGCAVSPPAIKTYHFEAFPLEEAAEPVAGTLDIGAFSVASHLRDAAIAARISPIEIEYYEGHRWAAPLEEFVPLAIARSLRASGAFREVSLRGSADLRLEGTILAFEEVDRGEEWWGAVELDLRLLRLGESVWAGTVRAERPAIDRHPEHVVEAIRAALGEAVGQALPEILSAEDPFAPASSPK